MENIVNGLNLLMTYIQQINRARIVSSTEDSIVVGPTDRQMTYDDVRLLKSFGWDQEGSDYNVVKPWFFRTQ